MEEHQTVDFWFLISAIILAGIGLVMVYSASMYLSLDKLGYGSYYFKKQAFNLLIGLFVMMFLTKVNYRGYAKLGTALLILGYIMLSILIVQKYLLDHEGAHRWLRIGKFSFQPSEFMKIIMIIYLSSAIMRMDEKVRDFKNGFLPLLSTIGLSFVLVVLEPDLGISGLLLITGLYVLFIGRAKLIHLIIISIPAISVIMVIATKVGYMKKRIDVFIHPELYMDAAHQINQSIISIGSGGLFGVGLGNSSQKFLFLPEHHTDFVFSICAEELGFTGTTIILAITLFYVLRGFRIASEAPDIFGFLLASGITAMIAFQVFINIGVTAGLLPTTGMTLPFISYGGSSLLLSFIGTGILLNISKQGNYERRLSKEFGSRLHRRSIWT